MEDGLSIDKELEQVVLQLGIPPCPRILLDLFAEAKKPEPDLHRIEKLICADVGLSAALIKTVNSPFYGLRSKVSSIMQAIHMLGLSHLSLMVTGMVLREVLKGIGQVDMARFWDASTKVAIISSYIAGRLPYLAFEQMRRPLDKDVAYTYSLFQDCGIPILLNRYANYKDILKLANQSADKKFTEIEDGEFVNNHARVGYLLAQSWGLPEAMCLAILNHHEHARVAGDPQFLPQESRDYIALALLAERSIQLITGLNQTCEWEKGGYWVMQHFGLSEADFNSIVKGIGILFAEGSLNG
jgi:HD-like signal output (HDOD) protein